MKQARGELRSRRRFVCDCGSELAGWSRKCLQNAVLGANCTHDLRSRLRKRLACDCSNQAGAGLFGDKVELLNLLATGAALAEEGVSVLVVGCPSMGMAFEGVVDGCWEFGAVGGKRIGLLLWSWFEEHVYVLRGAECSGLAARPNGFLDGCAPWCLSVVAGKGGRVRGRGGGGFRGGAKAAAAGPVAAVAQERPRKRPRPSLRHLALVQKTLL